ncbi:hypothetical protein KXX44_005584 [Aspergillus fumigatus]|nr:hypothetical protein KXX44_005584 [Aspergillus fumigatus]KAH1839844.1 hypothetical protein KXX55_004847 [Aspergillus fumigatus]KAH2442607.1 hypothetical protein KXV83_003341 [Aspergillus fumigatus]KAH2980035.1 hypothetical protein KXW58_003124 [Aspergillus fumigatus]KAH3036208.1 hypothetical protein KXW01_005084 [Aspergillus fumigatus]
MSLFILIYCRFGLRLSTPNSSAALVLTESQTSPSDQNVRDIGGLPTLPCPLPGTSYENSIELDMFSDEECDSSVRLDDCQQPGDSIDNPIDLDAATTVACNTGTIDNLSDRRHQMECVIDGRSFEEHYRCKICFCNVVDLALRCGHTYCSDCFNKYFHKSVLDEAMGSQRLACEYLESQQCKLRCPFCGDYLLGRYAGQNHRDSLDGAYVRLRCPDPESSHCFIKNYMVQGVKLKIP